MKKSYLIFLSFLTLQLSTQVFANSRVESRALIFHFISYGTGIDTEAFRTVHLILGREFLDGSIIKFIQTSWGREGERDICVQFNSQSKFMEIKAEVTQFTFERMITEEKKDCENK